MFKDVKNSLPLTSKNAEIYPVVPLSFFFFGESFYIIECRYAYILTYE